MKLDPRCNPPDPKSPSYNPEAFAAGKVAAENGKRRTPPDYLTGWDRADWEKGYDSTLL